MEGNYLAKVSSGIKDVWEEDGDNEHERGEGTGMELCT